MNFPISICDKIIAFSLRATRSLYEVESGSHLMVHLHSFIYILPSIYIKYLKKIILFKTMVMLISLNHYFFGVHGYF